MQNVEGKGVFYVLYIRGILVLFLRPLSQNPEEPWNFRKNDLSERAVKREVKRAVKRV